MADQQFSDKAISDLVRLGASFGKPNEIPGGNTPFIVIPNDHKVVDLSSYVHNERSLFPIRKKGMVTVLDVGSFCEYYSLFSDENSRAFANEQSASILAILDYHCAGENSARWGSHRINLALRHSEEWSRWKGNDGTRTNQMDFAEFIEDNAPDIVTPDPATMLEVARDLSAKTEADFGSAIRMQNGSVQFKCSEQIKGTFGAGNVEVPERFVIAIPVYVGSERVKITARLRYRINAGKLSFWYDLLRAEAVRRDAFLDVQKSIADTLGIRIINGVPAA